MQCLEMRIQQTQVLQYFFSGSPISRNPLSKICNDISFGRMPVMTRFILYLTLSIDDPHMYMEIPVFIGASRDGAMAIYFNNFYFLKHDMEDLYSCFIFMVALLSTELAAFQ